jgi:hypothetical protein
MILRILVFPENSGPKILKNSPFSIDKSKGPIAKFGKFLVTKFN